MKNIIEHFEDLLPAEQFIVTGSYAFMLLGLIKGGVQDIDIVLTNPTEESMVILKRLHNKKLKLDYPDDGRQYRVEFEGIHVDFFIETKRQKSITLLMKEKYFVEVAMPEDIIKAKQRYGSIKHVLQLKMIADQFYQPKDLEAVVKSELRKLRQRPSPLKGLHASTIVVDDLDVMKPEPEEMKPSKKVYQYATPQSPVKNEKETDDWDDDADAAPKLYKKKMKRK